MDHRQLLTKSLTLLWRESLIENKTENSNDTIRTAMEGIAKQDSIIGLSGSASDPIGALKEVVLQLCRNPLDQEYIKEDLLLTVKSATGDDTALYESVAQGINQELSPATIKKSVVNLRRELIDHFKEEAVMKVLDKATRDFRFNRTKHKSTASFVSSVVTELEPYQVATQRKDPAINDRVSIDDEGSVESIFSVVENENSGNGVIRTPWQSLNDVLDGGFRPGEFVMSCALQHEWKTGFSLSIFRGVPIYNKPFLLHKDKKPLIIRISLEDSLSSNFQFLFKAFKENETGECYKDEFKHVTDPETGEDKPVPLISAKQKAKYVIEKMRVNGWHIEMLAVNPIEWTYKDLFNLIIEREAEGYEVKFCMVDYLLKLPTTGCTHGPTGHDLRNLCERVKAFFAARKCIFFTPWQLSGQAKEEKRDGAPDLVLRLAGGGYTDGCKSLDHVVDVGLITNRVYKDREWYLDIINDKSRRVDPPPDELRRFALKFNNKGRHKGVILDDIGKENSAYRKPGGERVAKQTEEGRYYEF